MLRCLESAQMLRCSDAPPSVNDMARARCVGRLIRRKVEHKVCDLLSSSKPSHLLPGYEVLLGLHRILTLVHPAMPAWSLNSAWANSVHADLPPNKISRQTFCETNHCCLGCSVSKPIWCPLDRGGDRGHVDDMPSIRHQRGNGLTDPE